MNLVEVAALAVEATAGAPIVVLREQGEPHRLLPVFVGAPEAAAIALAISGQEPPRPLTHDLLAAIVRDLDGHVEAVEVTEVREGTLLATVKMHGPGGDHQLDSRPSDAIALAVRLGAPVFVSDAVLDEVGADPDVVLEIEEEASIDDLGVDEATIDEAVEEFRSFLDDLDPARFGDDPDLPPITEPEADDGDDPDPAPITEPEADDGDDPDLAPITEPEADDGDETR